MSDPYPDEPQQPSATQAGNGQQSGYSGPPVYPQQSGYSGPPVYPQQSGYSGPPVYPQQSGYSGPPVYPQQSGYSGSAYPQQPAYPGGAYPPPPGYDGYGQPQPSNGMAVAGLVCGIVGLVFFWFPIFGMVLAALGVIFGGVGISRANGGASNKGLAIAGLVCGLVAIALYVVIIVVVVSG